VTDYVAELKALWTDADYQKPIELPHSNCVAWVKKWIEEKRVIQIFKRVKFKKIQSLRQDAPVYSINLVS